MANDYLEFSQVVANLNEQEADWLRRELAMIDIDGDQEFGAGAAQEAKSAFPMPVICASNPTPDGGVEFIPLATLFQDNPYERVIPPGLDLLSYPDPEELHDG